MTHDRKFAFEALRPVVDLGLRAGDTLVVRSSQAAAVGRYDVLRSVPPDPHALRVAFERGDVQLLNPAERLPQLTEYLGSVRGRSVPVTARITRGHLALVEEVGQQPKTQQRKKAAGGGAR